MTELVKEETQNVRLPHGWAVGTIGDLVTVDGVFTDGDWVESKDQDPGGDVRLTQLADVGDGVFRDRSSRFLTSDKAQQLGCTLLRVGDLLIARMPDPLGRACIFPGDPRKSVTVVDVCVVRSGTADVDHRWLMHFINSPVFRSKIAALQSGSTRKRISRKNLAKIELPVPPSSEQRRIVEKIEELFTKLDAGVRALEGARAQLKSYRRSVLKDAVEGELSREWREAHRDEIEPASQLLERILRERREKFAGKTYKEPTSPDTSELPVLPEGWKWTKLDSLASIKGGVTKDTKRRYANSRTVPYLRVANVQRGYLDLSELKEIEASEDVIGQLLLKPGDVLFNEGGDRDKLGRGWIWNGEVAECIHQNHVFRARLYSANIEPKFVSWFGNTFGQAWFMKQGKQTTNLASINLTKLSAFPVPLPPSDEQRFIVAEVERRLSVVDKLEATVDANLKQANGLRQSILKRAFSGELVPQDPDDEPASALLERIGEERQATKQKPSNGRSGKTGPAERVQAEQGGLF